MVMHSAIEDIQRRATANAAAARSAAVESTEASTSASALAPVRDPQQDFFLAQIFDAPLKDDQATMEHPMFSLSKTPDSRFASTSTTGTQLPSRRATPASRRSGTSTPCSIRCRVSSRRRIVGSRVAAPCVCAPVTCLSTAIEGPLGEYNALAEAFERLARTRLRTDIKTGEAISTRLRLGRVVVDRCTTSNGMASIELTLSEWLYNAIVATKVLTLSRNSALVSA
jgi:hypothetical protein